MKKIFQLLSALGIGLFSVFTASASPALASMAVGLYAHTSYNAYGLEITNLTISNGKNTLVSSSLPSNIVTLQTSYFLKYPSIASGGPIAVATTGKSVNGTFYISYSALVFTGNPKNPSWASSTVNVTNIPITLHS